MASRDTELWLFLSLSPGLWEGPPKTGSLFVFLAQHQQGTEVVISGGSQWRMGRCFLWVAGKNVASITTEFLTLYETISNNGRQAAPGATYQTRIKIFKSRPVTEAPARHFPFKTCSFSCPCSPPSRRQPAGNGAGGLKLPITSADLSFPARRARRRAEGSRSHPRKCQALAARLGAGRAAGSPRSTKDSKTRLQLIKTRMRAVNCLLPSRRESFPSLPSR